MNWEDAYRQIAEYWELVKECKAKPLFSGERRALWKRLKNEHLPRINKILQGLDPELRPIRASMVNDHLAAWPTVARALVIFKQSEAMASAQHMIGEPVLPISVLDPVIAEAALPLWMAGKYRQAVADAATHLNTFVQTRIGRRDVSDKVLIEQAFSDKPPEEGKARLRCPGDAATETVRSQQDGARSFAVGTFQAIRNPAHHLTGDWNPALAFHQLVALSQVAYWFRHWDVVRHYPPLSDVNVINIPTTHSLGTQAESPQPLPLTPGNEPVRPNGDV